MEGERKGATKKSAGRAWTDDAPGAACTWTAASSATHMSWADSLAVARDLLPVWLPRHLPSAPRFRRRGRVVANRQLRDDLRSKSPSTTMGQSFSVLSNAPPICQALSAWVRTLRLDAAPGKKLATNSAPARARECGLTSKRRGAWCRNFSIYSSSALASWICNPLYLDPPVAKHIHEFVT